ncbi:hypothetical protein V1514DRAFT_330353 [Lipomyces japonicus]|uniref:uncharacterized protein n=1 Tax=Lipomyces japonicus TaxID=56871 RepID=UPI0034CE770C
MRSFQFLSFMCIALFAIFQICSGASKSSHNQRSGHDAQYLKSLLRTSNARPGLIRLTDKNFDQVVNAPRDYGLAVLLTAESPQMGCQLCREFAPDFNLVVHSWHHEHADSDKLFFAVLDFKDGKQTFQKLQLKTAPNVWVYPPTVGENAGPDKPFNYEILASPNHPQALIRFIQTHVPGVEIKINVPTDYTKFMTPIATVIGILSSIRFIYPYVKPVLQSRTAWAGLSLVGILMFISGHMFNNIRHTPYVAGNNRGGVQYIAPGFMMQYGFETQAIAVLYAFLSFATISVAIKVPRISNPARQTAAVTLWVTVILVLFSVLLYIFRIKNGGYPFWLPPLAR